MPITLDTFKAVANSTVFSSRGIIVQGEGKAATARLGNFIFSQGKAANNATMAAFKEALENEYGSLGTHAFDTVLGVREVTGLKNLSTILGAGKTSIEDQIKKGVLGVGMSVNRSDANNILLERIKTNGVEPGFLYRNDWSPTPFSAAAASRS